MIGFQRGKTQGEQGEIRSTSWWYKAAHSVSHFPHTSWNKWNIKTFLSEGRILNDIINLIKWVQKLNKSELLINPCIAQTHLNFWRSEGMCSPLSICIYLKPNFNDNPRAQKNSISFKVWEYNYTWWIFTFIFYIKFRAQKDQQTTYARQVVLSYFMFLFTF